MLYETLHLPEAKKKNDLNAVFNEPLPSLIRKVPTAQKTKPKPPAAAQQPATTQAPHPSPQPEPRKTVKTVATGSLFKSDFKAKTSLQQLKESTREKTTPTHENASPAEVKPADLQQIQALIDEFKTIHHENLILKTLLSGKITTENEWVIIEYNSKAIEETINRNAQNILDFLRKKSNNYSIQLKFNLKEKAVEKTIFTQKEKLEKICEDNPNVKLLIEKLNLHLE